MAYGRACCVRTRREDISHEGTRAPTDEGSYGWRVDARLQREQLLARRDEEDAAREVNRNARHLAREGRTACRISISPRQPLATVTVVGGRSRRARDTDREDDVLSHQELAT